MDIRALRESLTPPLSRMELARKLGVSYTFLRQLESGVVSWPAKRVAQLDRVLAAWCKRPTPKPRKPRKDIGKKHRRRLLLARSDSV